MRNVIRVSYNDLKKMITKLDKCELVQDKDKTSILISCEGVTGIGNNLDMTVQDALIKDMKANVTFEISGPENW